jgi:hypothetical protein
MKPSNGGFRSETVPVSLVAKANGFSWYQNVYLVLSQFYHKCIWLVERGRSWIWVAELISKLLYAHFHFSPTAFINFYDYNRFFDALDTGH